MRDVIEQRHVRGATGKCVYDGDYWPCDARTLLDRSDPAVGLREVLPGSGACVFGPEREPWNCRTHRGGMRTRLDESVCSIVVAEGQYGVPLSEEELVEVRVWMRNRRGKPASRGMLAAERLLATLDLERELAATPTASPTATGEDSDGS